MALGYIRREVGVPGREVMIGRRRATVAPVAVHEVALRRESALEQHPA